MQVLGMQRRKKGQVLALGLHSCGGDTNKYAFLLVMQAVKKIRVMVRQE